MFPEIKHGTLYRENLDIELRRKYVREVRDFWLALHGFYRLSTHYDAGNVDIQTRRLADAYLAQQLRELVDAWLASGHTEDGCEYPYQRKLSDAQTDSLNRFLRDRPDGAGPYILFQAGMSLPPDLESPELDDVTHRSKHIRQIASNRKLEGEKMKKSSALRIGVDVSFPLWQPRQWEQHAANEAQRLFAMLLDAGGLRFLLVRCGRCGRYDFIKTRERYIRGWHCPPCDKIVARSASRAAKYDEWKEKWMKVAVKVFCKQIERHGIQADLLTSPEWLAEQVNKQLDPAEKKIKQNSITHNLKEIEERATKKQVKRSP